MQIVYTSDEAGLASYIQGELRWRSRAGGTAVALTHDVASDFSPSWSPDGKFMYFACDRSGSTGAWRVPVDEAPGKPQGSAESVAPGTSVSMDLPHLSAHLGHCPAGFNGDEAQWCTKRERAQKRRVIG